MAQRAGAAGNARSRKASSLTGGKHPGDGRAGGASAVTVQRGSRRAGQNACARLQGRWRRRERRQVQEEPAAWRRNGTGRTEDACGRHFESSRSSEMAQQRQHGPSRSSKGRETVYQAETSGRRVPGVGTGESRTGGMGGGAERGRRSEQVRAPRVRETGSCQCNLQVTPVSSWPGPGPHHQLARTPRDRQTHRSRPHRRGRMQSTAQRFAQVGYNVTHFAGLLQGGAMPAGAGAGGRSRARAARLQASRRTTCGGPSDQIGNSRAVRLLRRRRIPATGAGHPAGDYKPGSLLEEQFTGVVWRPICRRCAASSIIPEAYASEGR